MSGAPRIGDSEPVCWLDKLNPAQRAAATHGRRTPDGSFESGPLLVIAGAGTGKTMTLAHRVANLVVAGVAPERVLLLTFTRRAADEMTRRVEAIVGIALGERRVPGSSVASFRLPWAGTFHSVANRLLRRFAPNLGLDPGFSVLDRGDAADLLDVVRHESGLSAKSRRFPGKNTCLAIYSRTVNRQCRLEETLREDWPWCSDWEPELATLFRAYVERKQATQALDYDDLLLYWSHLVAEPEFADQIGGWFDHVLVDEYQDTNRLQAAILRSLKPDGRGVTAVGDDAQSIYSFRAAEVDNILSFPAQFVPAAEVIKLERNYRSVQPVLDSANCLIAQSDHQYAKDLRAERGGGARPLYVTVEDGDAEAEYVVGEVLANREAGSRLMDQAVLFRSAHHSDRLELELTRRNIPYVKYGGLRFLEAAHVKDLLAILKWGENPRNEIAAFRVLKLLPGIGPAVAAKCFARLELEEFSFAGLRDFEPPRAAAADWPDFVGLMQLIGSAEPTDPGWQGQIGAARAWYRPHMEGRFDDIAAREADLEQLHQIASRYASRERFLTELTLDPPAASGGQAGDPLLDEDYLVLSTVHSAKGQEWSAVFVLNVTDGNFPSEFATGSAASVAEERRLLYVAITRARDSLSLVAPLRFHVTQQAPGGDRHVYGARSRFLTDELLSTFDARFAGRAEGGEALVSRSATRIDVASRMRNMW